MWRTAGQRTRRQEWGYELCPTPRAANGGGITSVMHSYIYHPRDAAMPIVSINTSQDYFDDPAIGFWNNFEQNWRRPVNVEYFTELGEESVINQLGELRIHGGVVEKPSAEVVGSVCQQAFRHEEIRLCFLGRQA